MDFKSAFLNNLFYGKHGEVIRYLFIGGLNVLITWGTYAALVLAGVSPAWSNAISWVIGVFVAFVLNKIFVFDSKTREKKTVGKEVTYFLFGRIFTGIVNIVGFALLYSVGLNQEIFGVDGFAAKMTISIIEIALNYAISKYIVFVKKTDN